MNESNGQTQWEKPRSDSFDGYLPSEHSPERKQKDERGRLLAASAAGLALGAAGTAYLEQKKRKGKLSATTAC